jgi:hypothetical protein
MGTREEASKLVDDRPLMIGPGPIGLRAVCVKHFTDRSWGFGQIDRRRSVLSLHEPAFLPSTILTHSAASAVGTLYGVRSATRRHLHRRRRPARRSLHQHELRRGPGSPTSGRRRRNGRCLRSRRAPICACCATVCELGAQGPPAQQKSEGYLARMRYNSYRRLFYRSPVGTARAAVLVVGVLAGLGFLVNLFQNEPVPYPITVYGDAARGCVHKLNESYTTHRNIEAHQICAGLPHGCIDWQRNGLIRPAVVTQATDDYFQEQDTFRQWIGDRCQEGRELADTFASLLASWRNYALQQGEEPGTSKSFGAALRRADYQPIKDEDGIRGRGFRGLKVNVHFEPLDPSP